MLALGVCHPHVQRPQIGYRYIGEGQVMQIAVGTELGCQRADLIAAEFLGAPDGLPMLLMEGQRWAVLGGGGVGHWRPLVITDPGLNVVNAFDEGAEVVERIIEQALAGDDPMTDVTGEAQVRQLTNQLEGDPRVEQRASAMGFKGAHLVVLAREVHGAAKEVDLLCQWPAVVARQEVDEARRQLGGPTEFLIQVQEVFVDTRRLFRQDVVGAEDGADLADMVSA